jgi:hypothetical protein
VTASTFGQLFRYARGSRHDALENFTTEAFAAASRENPKPLVRLLRDHSLIRGDFEPTDVAVQTQAHVKGAGIIDLIVELSGHSESAEVWLEVKIGAPESGMQIANYLQWIGSAPDHLRHVWRPCRPSHCPAILKSFGSVG